MELVQEVYSICRKLPQNEQFALAGQMRRAAISIPSNIAEGSKRSTEKDFKQFLHIASGSSAELETQLIIAQSEYRENEYEKVFSLLDEVQRMLYKLIASMHLKTQNAKLKTRSL